MEAVTFWQILLANGALILGSCLQGIVGYGIGTLAAPLLFLISPYLIPGPLAVNALLLTVMMLLRHRGALEFRQVRYAIGGGAVGSVLAALTLLWLPAKGFDLVFGGLILLGVGLSVGGFRPALTTSSSLLGGAASSYMGTITAVGGPPIAMIYQNEKGPLVRANLSAFFLVATMMSVAALWFSGYFGRREIELFLVTFPGVLLGFWLSGPLARRIPVRGLRPMILGVAAVAGAAALVRGVLNYTGIF